jgi:hypothetical protein
VTRSCAICGQPLLPGEELGDAELVPFHTWQDQQGREVEPREYRHNGAIHVRCMVADPEAAERLLREMFE